jgi:hypothetical protein
MLAFSPQGRQGQHNLRWKGGRYTQRIDDPQSRTSAATNTKIALALLERPPGGGWTPRSDGLVRGGAAREPAASVQVRDPDGKVPKRR